MAWDSRAVSIAAGGAVILSLAVLLVVDLQSTAHAVRRTELQQLNVPRRRGLARKQGLWVTQDNGIVTNINVRGTENAEGGISYNGNFVYGPAGTPVVQPDAVQDQWWRYGDQGYKVVTGPSSGGSTPHYEMINVGPMQSDGTEWGYVPEPSSPTYDYFPQTFYPSSEAYNYPGTPMTPGIAKEAYIQNQGYSAVHTDGSVGQDHPDNSFSNVGMPYHFDY